MSLRSVFANNKIYYWVGVNEKEQNKEWNQNTSQNDYPWESLLTITLSITGYKFQFDSIEDMITCVMKCNSICESTVSKYYEKYTEKRNYAMLIDVYESLKNIIWNCQLLLFAITLNSV